MSYWRAGAPQTCKNTVAPIRIVAKFLLAPQFLKGLDEESSGHNETPPWLSMSSYGLHSTRLSDPSSLILRGVSTLPHNAKNTVAPIGILANVPLARWRFADLQKRCSAYRNRGKILIGAPVLNRFG